MKKYSFKYYLSIIIISFIFIAILEVLAHSQGIYLIATNINFNGALGNSFYFFLYKKSFIIGKYLLDLLVLLFGPILFALLYYGIDKLTSLLRSKKKKEMEKKEMAYESFTDTISKSLSNTKKFNYEDFRHFRDNKKMQEVLKKLFDIYSFGETESNNYRLVERKFDKKTREGEAVKLLIGFTEDLRLKKEEKVKDE